MSKRPPVIISCALTGAGDTRPRNPAVPVTPREIAEQAIDAARAGASIVHIHVRDPQTGKSSTQFAYYEEVVHRIRDSRCGVLINLTTGPGTLLTIPTDPPFRIAAIQDAELMTPQERVAHVVKLKPDICSLDVATMNFGEAAFVNTAQHLREMAAEIAKAGVTMELEIFDLGHARLASHLIGMGAIPRSAYFQLCLSVPWGAPATPTVVAEMQRLLPAGANWSAFGIGPEQFPMVATASILGGHVRVGLEDNLYVSPGKLARDNAELVAKAARIIEDLGYEVATADYARSTLLGA
ncbi:3-keto-5-aminohexanoate cleavage protein [Variovorax sp. Varisp62]|uniref:3-keto-5-aminohexanoate cleavage protein n=1 Tax=Variovorax sp. Varisp62 TaxID=3243049 RepID=UPI0039B676B2